MSQNKTPASPQNRPTPKPWIDALHAYVPGKSKGTDGRPLVKLSANENPLGSSAAALTARADAAIRPADYPDPDSALLRETLGETYGVDAARIVCGTGSGELLYLAAQGFAGVGDEILYVRYGFSLYEIAARRVGATPVEAPDKDYATDVDALLAAVTPATRVVYLANPNNPTGTWTPMAEVRRLHAALPADVLLVLDQAYVEYLPEDEGADGLALAADSDNVLVTRTFSKIYGLAAERVGWAFGAPHLIDTLNRIRGPFNVSSSAQKATVAALKDQAFVEGSRTHNATGLTKFTADMALLSDHGVRAIPSAANFALVLFEGQFSAETVYSALMEGGYITRHLPNQGLAHGLRITIGTEAQMQDVTAIIRATVTGAA